MKYFSFNKMMCWGSSLAVYGYHSDCLVSFSAFHLVLKGGSPHILWDLLPLAAFHSALVRFKSQQLLLGLPKSQTGKQHRVKGTIQMQEVLQTNLERRNVRDYSAISQGTKAPAPRPHDYCNYQSSKWSCLNQTSQSVLQLHPPKSVQGFGIIHH